jgi:hypothetical protein
VAIVITLLLANFVIPILAKPKTSDLEARKQQEYMDAYIKALRESIRALENDMEKAVVVHERLAYQTVIEEQSKLIIELKDKYNIYNDDDKDIQELYAKTLQWQIEYIEEMQKEPSTAKRFSKKTLDGFKKRLKTSKKNCLHSNIVTKSMQNMVSSTITLTRMFKNTVTSSDDELDESSRLKVACASYVLGKLSPRSKTRSCYKPEVIAVISNKYKKYIDFEKEEISITQTIKSNDNADEIRRRALYYQHQSADEQYADKEITRETLSRLRRQIAVMQIDLAEEI